MSRASDRSRSRLHQYLTDAYMRGMDHGDKGEGYEMRIARAETWAREYLDLRPGIGIAPTETDG